MNMNNIPFIPEKHLANVERTLQEAVDMWAKNCESAGILCRFTHSQPHPKISGAYRVLYWLCKRSPANASTADWKAIQSAKAIIDKFWDQTGVYTSYFRWTVPGVINMLADLWLAEYDLTDRVKDKWEPNHYGFIYEGYSKRIFYGGDKLYAEIQVGS